MPISALAKTDFVPMTPEEAARIFSKRAKLTGRGLRAIRDEARKQAGVLAVEARAKIVQRAMEIIRQGITRGDSFATVQRRLISAFSDLGGFQVPLHRLRLITRQSTLTSFNVARQRVQNSEPVRAAFPYIQYITVADKNVRPTHKALHKKIFLKSEFINSPIYPPWDYNCRCTTRDVSQSEVDRLGGARAVTPLNFALTSLKIPGTDQRGIEVRPEFDHPRDQFRGGRELISQVEPSLRRLVEDALDAKLKPT